jgi:TonB family protein
MSITLRDVVTRETPLEWFDSVAIVQAVCAESVRQAGSAVARIPDLEWVVLTQNGEVVLTDPGPDQPAVLRAARLLQSLLPEGRTPASLRLLVLTALASTPTPRYVSLGEFSEALAYFDRPDRQAVLAGVHAVATQLPAAAADTSVRSRLAGGEALEPAPIVLPELSPEDANALEAFLPEARWKENEAIKPASRAGRARPLRLVAALCPTLVVGLFGVWWLWPGGAVATLPAPRPPAALRAAAEALRPSPPAEAEVTPAPAVVTSPPVVAALTTSGRLARAPARLERERARRAVATQAFPGALQPRIPADAGPSLKEPPSPNGGLLDTTRRQPAAAVDEVIFLQPDAPAEPPRSGGRMGPIYSAEDADVKPPVAIGRAFPYDPPPGVPPDRLVRVEIVVSPTGFVESARVVGGARTYFDGMVLSAAKTWTFQPATRDERPVTYRCLGWLSTR